MDNRVITEEERGNQKIRKEKLGGYFLDMSKLTFGAVVLGGIATIFHNSSWVEAISILIGCAMTAIFGMIGNNFLKLK